MWEPLLIGLLMLYFIREQFEFNHVSRLNFWIIPIFALGQFIAAFHATWHQLPLLGLIIVISLLIGYYQARNTQIRIEKRPVYYYDDAQQVEQPIYKKGAATQGGYPYLVGWLIIFITQLGLEFTVLKEPFSWHLVVSNAWQEVLADVFSAYRFSNAGQGAWLIWALTGFSSLAYTWLLSRRSKAVHEAVFGQERQYEPEAK